MTYGCCAAAKKVKIYIGNNSQNCLENLLQCHYTGSIFSCKSNFTITNVHLSVSSLSKPLNSLKSSSFIIHSYHSTFFTHNSALILHLSLFIPVLQRSFEDLRSSKIFSQRSIFAFVFGPFQIVEEYSKL